MPGDCRRCNRHDIADKAALTSVAIFILLNLIAPYFQLWAIISLVIGFIIFGYLTYKFYKKDNHMSCLKEANPHTNNRDRSKECLCPCHTGNAKHIMACRCYSGEPVLDGNANEKE